MDEKIEQIFHAIKLAVEALDSQAELARRCGINKSYVNNYLSGKVKNMELDMFFRLYPHIKKYLPEGFLDDSECEKLCKKLGNMEKGFMKDLMQYTGPEKSKIWKAREEIESERLKNRIADTLSNTG